MNKKEYLENRIKPIMENLIVQLVLERPEEPTAFMVDWLQKTAGEEKEEIAILKKDIMKYRQKEKENNSFDKEEEEDFVYDMDDENRKGRKNIEGRKAISAEAYGKYNKKEKFKPRYIQKSDSQITRIKGRILQSFLFNALEAKDVSIVIGAMEEKTFNAGDVVIQQGDEGDCLYIVDSGELDCFKLLPNNAKEKFLKTYVAGEAFGELALLYNCPRAATIKAKTSCVLWCLDRDTFNNIVKESARMKRQKYESFLKSVEILSTMDDYETSVVSEALRKCAFREGEYIIRQGEVGDVFYIIEEGEAMAFGSKDHGKAAIPEMNYTKGNYFGELSLLRDQPRAANVKAKTDVKLLALDRNSFKRVLGPIDIILKRNAEKYKKYVNHGK